MRQFLLRLFLRCRHHIASMWRQHQWTWPSKKKFKRSWYLCDVIRSLVGLVQSVDNFGILEYDCHASHNGLVAHFYRNSTDQIRSGHQSFLLWARGTLHYPPNLEIMKSGWNFHLFASHAWATGQDKTRLVRLIVRKLELLWLPRLVVWLDVDNLYNTDKLGMSVSSDGIISFSFVL